MPEGVDEITFKVKKDGSIFTTVTVKNSDDWMASIEHLVPKKLVTLNEKSSVYGSDGETLGKTEYVPYVYTVEEDLTSFTGELLELMKAYDVAYEYTATETSDGTSFTNITSKYDDGKLVYYIPASGSKPAADAGAMTVTNSLSQEIILRKVGVNNTDPTHTQVNLGGAKFTVYTEVNGKRGTVVKVGNRELTGLTSDDATGVFFSGELLYGTYLIHEDSAPAGYNMLAGDIKLVISRSGITVTPAFTAGESETVCAIEESSPAGGGDGSVTIRIVNTAGVELPHTGGSGTRLFYILGAMLLISGVVYFVSRRRVDHRQFK